MKVPGARSPYLARLKPRWAWVLLACGLPWAVLPFPQNAALRTLLVFSAIAFWFALLVLGFLGLRWAWRKWMFKVSRRLLLILGLLSVLPALGLTTLFLSLGWLGIGGQVSRTLLGNLKAAESAMKRANEDPRDVVALEALKGFGDGQVVRVGSLPEGVEPGFVGLVWNDSAPIKGKGVFLRAVSQEPGGYRLLNVSLGSLATQGGDLWGGRVHYRVDRVPSLDAKGRRGPRVKMGDGDDLPLVLSPQEPLAAWSQGQPLEGSGLFHPFKLPAVSTRVQDWKDGSELLLTAKPETNLVELFKGYGFKSGNRSAETVFVIAVVVLLLMALFVIQCGATLMGLYLARQLGKSVDDLFAGVARLSGGDFSARIRPRTRDQVGQLALAFNQMAARIQEFIQERQVRLKLEEELRVAREVQMHLLPDIPALAHGAAVHATLQPAKEVAGDYYDLYRLADGRLAFLIADVSGKGTSAAFYAAETKGVLAALDKVKRGPLEVAARLNEIWCEGHGRRIFMTMVYGLFDPGSGAFQLVRCGHPAPLLRRADGRVETVQSRGLGIGLSPRDFEVHTDLATGRIEPGDALLCYTDGLSEAADAQQALFGEACIAEVLAASAEGIPERLLAAVNAHTGGAAPEDDLTLVLLRR